MSRVTVLQALVGALLAAIFAASALAASTSPAAADFRLCNNTASRVGVAVGYKDTDGWTTEGWWNLPARTCETVVKGNLVARYYYVYAIDYDRGGEWMGQAYMCTRDREFTIRGIGDCLARGYDHTGFFEVDTGEQRAWTVQLTESSEQPSQKPPPSTGPVSANPPAVTPPPAGTLGAPSPSAVAPAAASPLIGAPAADVPGNSAASPAPSTPSRVQTQ
ncbi:MAG: DUF1036 domain-containing protein [Xanthobacteraceae bacterium]